MIDFGLGVHLRSFNGGLLPLSWRNDPKVWRWTRQNDLISNDQHFAWFEKLAKDPTVKMYYLTKDARTIGVCGFTSLNWQNRNAEFSLYLAAENHKKGLSKPSLITLFAHGFKNLGLKSIWGETFEGNHALKVFNDIGMKIDGKRRSFYWKDGKYWDAHMISILDYEFLAEHGELSCF